MRLIQGGKKAPLRKVIETVMTPYHGNVSIPQERLECGHLIRIRYDYRGETVAAKRRCWQCADAPHGLSARGETK